MNDTLAKGLVVNGLLSKFSIAYYNEG
ncbi:hypothetical protein VCR17J2_390174 [Vibrio coralliirubri]|nr:hypothetical protein VCR17J2_390174 [Vibrio coralliirubri]